MPYKDPVKQRHAQHASYERRKQSQMAKTRAQRKKRRDLVETYKLDKGCEHCGYSRCGRALHAHHHSNNKESGISEMIAGCVNIEKIFVELEKCTILCANCHIEEHAPLE